MARTLRRLLAATVLSASLVTATAAPAVAAPPAATAEVVCIVIVYPDGSVLIICIF